MLIVRICFLILIIFTLNVRNIDLEYYDDERRANDSQSIIDESDARRTIELKDLSEVKDRDSDNSKSNALYNYGNNQDGDDDSIILSYQVERPREFLFNTAYNVKNNSSKVEYTQNVSNTTAKPIHTTLKTPIDLKILRDYDYYNYNQGGDKFYMLRNKASSGIFNNANKLYDNSLDKMQYSRFFNVEPAVDVDDIEINDKEIQTNIWYVPQDFPCWELPVLYGELGTRIKKSDIFLIYGGSLVNVVDPWTKTRSSYKTVDPPMSHTMNKWCEVEPCYGDHTLCLFSSKRISNICEKNYKIHVPSIMDQFTIVNTLNSMRNRVANGLTIQYSHLPTAANMKQVTYDYDLEKMAEVWLRQCLPGGAPCSALDGNIVSQLECTKYMKYCCLGTKTTSRCVPKSECFIHPVVGCLHIWFSSARENITETDINCGRPLVSTFNTVQLLWAKTSKMGCAYGERANGDTRVVCNFSPGAPFHLETKLFCGVIAHSDIQRLRNDKNVTSPEFISALGIKWDKVLRSTSMSNNLPIPLTTKAYATTNKPRSVWGIDSLVKVYNADWIRKQFADRENGTKSFAARLVARYIFIDESESRCDTDESVYVAGIPGSMCVERSRTFHSLCYDYRDPTPGYRLIAILAPIALFSLISYDLFSGVVRQTIY